MENLKSYIDEIFEQSIERAVFSKPDSACEYRKIVLVRKKGAYQLEKYTQKQVFHENIDFNKISERVCEIMQNMCVFPPLWKKEGDRKKEKKKGGETTNTEIQKSRTLRKKEAGQFI